MDAPTTCPSKSSRYRTIGAICLLVAFLALLVLPCLPIIALNPPWTVFIVEASPIYSAAFFPDGERVVATHGDGKLRVYDIRAGQELHHFNGLSSSAIVSVVVSPDGRRIASTSNDGGYTCILRLWDAESGEPIRPLVGESCLAEHCANAASLVFTPDGRQLLSGGYDQTVRLWDVEKGTEVHRLKGHTGEINGVAVTTDGRHVISGAGDYAGGELHDPTVRVWNLATGQELVHFEGHTGAVKCVAVSSDGVLAASGDYADWLRVWEVQTGKERWSAEGVAGDMETDFNAVAFSPDSRYVLAGLENGELRLYDVATGRVVRTFKGHTCRIWSVGFSPDGQKALSTSGTWDDRGYKVLGVPIGEQREVDCTLRIWEVETGKELCRFE